MTGNFARQPPQVALADQRRYDITYLRHDGELDEIACLAPALPAFEEAFAVLGRGTILHRRNGAVAVEDLLPGDDVMLADGRFARLLWRGAITLVPRDDRAARLALTRITADALGPDRPMQDLILGPAARLLHHSTDIARLTGHDSAYIPASDFVDDAHFITLRPTAAVDLYQLGFAGHETLLVNGIGVESLLPGTAFSLGLRGAGLDQYRALFPHLDRLEDAGLPSHPRLRLPDLQPGG